MKNKIAQAERREIRKKVDGMFKTFEEHLKPKKWWMPTWLWRWWVKQVVDIDV